MPVLPANRSDLVEFCERHVPVLTVNAGAVGLTGGQVGEMADLAEAARAALVAQEAAKAAAVAATLRYHLAAAALRAKMADLVRIVKTHAETTGDPGVYSLAQIPPPASPGKRPAPGQPTDIKIDILPGGAVKLAWKSAGAGGGGFFTVRRRVAGSRDGFVIAGTAGGREFVDETLPAGGGPWEYVIQGFRRNVGGTTAGPESPHLIVTLGSVGVEPATRLRAAA